MHLKANAFVPELKSTFVLEAKYVCVRRQITNVPEGKVHICLNAKYMCV